MENYYFPNLFIPGFPKCGTTSLAGFLDKSDDIFVPYGKEPNIFRGNVNQLPYRVSLYRKDIKRTYRYYVDATPTYLCDCEDFLRQVDSVYPIGIKFIVMIRDPIQRYVSHYMHNASRGGENRSILNVMSMELDKCESGKLNSTEYLKYSFYSDSIRFLGEKGFDPLIIHIDGLKNESKVRERISDYLGISFGNSCAIGRSNSAYSPKSRMLHSALFSQKSTFVGMRKLVPRRLKKKYKQMLIDGNNSGEINGRDRLYSLALKYLYPALQYEIEFANYWRTDCGSTGTCHKIP